MNDQTLELRLLALIFYKKYYPILRRLLTEQGFIETKLWSQMQKFDSIYKNLFDRASEQNAVASFKRIYPKTYENITRLYDVNLEIEDGLEDIRVGINELLTNYMRSEDSVSDDDREELKRATLDQISKEFNMIFKSLEIDTIDDKDAS